MAENGKFYWLKLKRDFFKRHDIRIIESMPNGKEYVLFYLKLLMESVDHEGELRFSDTIPYNEQMLSIITNTNIDIVKSALSLFQQLNLIEIMDNQTIYMNEVEKLIGSETKWAEIKKKQRERLDNVQLLSNKCPVEIDKDIEINKDIYKERIEKKATFVAPTLQEVEEYVKDNNLNVNPNTFVDFYESKGWMVGKTKMKDWKAACRRWSSTEKKEKPKSDTGSFETNEFFNQALNRTYRKEN